MWRQLQKKYLGTSALTQARPSLSSTYMEPSLPNGTLAFDLVLSE